MNDTVYPVIIGFSQFKVTCSAASPHQKYVIDVIFDISDYYAGSLIGYSILFADHTLKSGTFNKYGQTKIQLEVTSAKQTIDLKVATHIISYSIDFPVNNAASEDVIGFVGQVNSSVTDYSHDLRSYLVKSCADFCDQVNLRGRYMNEHKLKYIYDKVTDAISQKKPFSVVRLGDGEGRILGYPEVFSQTELLTQVISYHFGPASIKLLKSQYASDWIDQTALDIRNKLEMSIDAADIVGIPVYDFFRSMDEEVTSGMIGYGCAWYGALKKLKNTPKDLLYGTNLFQLLAETPDFFSAILPMARKTVIIGPWDITESLKKIFNIPEIDYIEVPRHYTWGGGVKEGHYPNLYKVVEKEIDKKGDMRGMLVLVGAGLLGKHYCRLAQLQGAVALDVGSVFDSWANKGLPYAVRNNERINLDVFNVDN